MRSRRFIFVLFFFVCSATALAENRAYQRHMYVPEMFYHWISIDSINKEKKVALVENGFLPLPRLYDSFKLVDSAPKLAMTKGMFVWSHPIGGVGTAPEEIYGDMGALIAIKTKNRLHNVLVLETEEGGKQIELKNDLRSIELLLHRHYAFVKGLRTLLFEEWVIKKPSVAQEFTADPKILGPRLQKEIAFMESGAKYAETDLHTKHPMGSSVKEPFANNQRERNTYILPRLKRYLSLPQGRFDGSWLRPLSSCQSMELDFDLR